MHIVFAVSCDYFSTCKDCEGLYEANMSQSIGIDDECSILIKVPSKRPVYVNFIQ